MIKSARGYRRTLEEALIASDPPSSVEVCHTACGTCYVCTPGLSLEDKVAQLDGATSEFSWKPSQRAAAIPQAFNIPFGPQIPTLDHNSNAYTSVQDILERSIVLYRHLDAMLWYLAPEGPREAYWRQWNFRERKYRLGLRQPWGNSRKAVGDILLVRDRIVQLRRPGQQLTADERMEFAKAKVRVMAAAYADLEHDEKIERESSVPELQQEMQRTRLDEQVAAAMAASPAAREDEGEKHQGLQDFPARAKAESDIRHLMRRFRCWGRDWN